MIRAALGTQRVELLGELLQAGGTGFEQAGSTVDRLRGIVVSERARLQRMQADAETIVRTFLHD